MSDAGLRELQRRFQASGAPEDELAYLCGRVRNGELLDGPSYARLSELDLSVTADYL